MKHLYCFLLIALIGGCGTKQNAEQTDSTTASASDTSASLPVADNVDPDASPDKFYAGTINKNLQIEAMLTFGGNEVVGSYRYITQDARLSLGGTMEGETIRLYEKSLGKVTGTFSGIIKGDSIVGTWSNGKKEFPFSLKLKSSSEPVILGTRKYESKKGNCVCGPYMIPVVEKAPTKSAIGLLEVLLGYEELIGGDACDCSGEYPSGIISSDFTVLYNRGNYLSVSVYAETMGAYPDGYTRYKNFDFTQNKEITIKDLYTQQGIDYMLKVVQAEIKSRLDEARKQEGVDDDAVFNSTVEQINAFSLGEKSITLQNNLEFPHYIKAYQPDDAVTIPVSDLQKYEKVKWY